MSYTYKYYKNDTIADNYIKFVKINMTLFSLLAIIIVISIFVEYLTISTLCVSVFTLISISLWSYFIHILFHKYSSTFGIIHQNHHNNTNNATIYDKITEFILNFILFGGVIWLFPITYIQNLTDFYLFNPYVILVWSIVYTSYHSFNYHIFKTNEIHREHHENLECNYGPEWFDIIFGTKCDGSDIEDMNSAIFNIIIVSIGVLCLQDTKYDILSRTIYE